MPSIPELKVYTTTALGVLLSLEGLSTFLYPSTALRNFGLPCSPSNREALALVPLFGGRNAALGISATWLAWAGKTREAGLVLAVFTAVMGGTDIYVTVKHGGKYMTHVVGTGLCLGLCAWLLN